MITVKLYGLLRLDSGIKERQLEASSVREVQNKLIQMGLKKQDLDACIVLINGTQANRRSKLNDGDVVTFLSPVAGG